jgi:hypothetical protein
MPAAWALLGGVSLVLGTGIGSEIGQPLGYAMSDGLLVSQLPTLFSTPVVYIYMDRLGHLADPIGRPGRKYSTPRASRTRYRAYRHKPTSHGRGRSRGGVHQATCALAASVSKR